MKKVYTTYTTEINAYALHIRLCAKLQDKKTSTSTLSVSVFIQRAHIRRPTQSDVLDSS